MKENKEQIRWLSFYNEEGFTRDSEYFNLLKSQSLIFPDDVQWYCEKNNCCASYVLYEYSEGVQYPYLYSPIVLVNNKGEMEEIYPNDFHCSIYDPFEGHLYDYFENFDQLFPMYSFDVYDYMTTGNIPSEIREYCNLPSMKKEIRDKAVEMLQDYQLVKDRFKTMKYIFDNYDQIDINSNEWISKYGENSDETRLFQMIDDESIKCYNINNRVLIEKIFHPNIRMGVYMKEVSNDAMEYNQYSKSKYIINMYQ